MKLVASIFLYLCTLVTPGIGTGVSDVVGTWKGHYGTVDEIYEITVRIEPGYTAEIICNYNDACFTSTGSYKLIGDSAIIITSLLADSKTPEVVLYGILNRTASFINGDWDGTGNEKGCFYLRKQPAQTLNY